MEKSDGGGSQRGHSDAQITLDQHVHPPMDTRRMYQDMLSVFYGQIYGQARQRKLCFMRNLGGFSQIM